MLAVAIGLLISAFLLSLAGTWLARRFAGKLGMMDQPGDRKVHLSAKPRNGGMALFWAIAVPLLAGVAIVEPLSRKPFVNWLPKSVKIHLPGLVAHRGLALLLIGCTLAIHLLGLADDRRALGPKAKLFWQFLIAAALVVGGEFLHHGGFRVLTLLDHKMTGGIFVSGIISAVWLVLLTNAFNFMDNMDGLSAGVAGICALMFFIAAIQSHQWFICGLLLLYLGAVLGFLWFNFPPSSIFMGDGGSMVLGFFLAALTIRTTYYTTSGRWYSLFMPLVVTAVPIYDLVVVSLVRVGRGRSPMTGDTNHFSHRLTRHGFSQRGAVLVIYAVTLDSGLSAPLLAAATNTMAVLIAAQCASILLIVGILERVGDHTK